MPEYCINRKAQPISGDHEVHDLTPGACHTLPSPENRIALGYHANCQGAVAKAKRDNPSHSAKIDGCIHCCNPCHNH